MKNTSTDPAKSSKVGGKDKFTWWQPNAKLAATVKEYWTEERRAKAIPEDDGGRLAGPRAELLGAAERADVNATPFKHGGKLYYTRDGNDYEASAQFVSELNILICAAHSMWRSGKSATNIMFYRAYSNGGGTAFTIDRAAILTAWMAISDDPPSIQRSASDYAALRTTANSDGGTFTLSKDGSFVEATLMGYPAALENGKYMYRQITAKLAQVGDAYEASPYELSPGASGGAWFVDASGYKAVSIISSKIGTSVTGPAFTATTEEMITFVKNGCE